MPHFIDLVYDKQHGRSAYLILRRREVTEHDRRGLYWSGGPGRVYLALYVWRCVIAIRAVDYEAAREATP